MAIEILPFEPGFATDCSALVEALPDWFGIPESNASYLRNLSRLPSWVALRDGVLVAAITLEPHFPGSFEVHFMAVRPEHHRQGIGRLLLAHLEATARQRGAQWLHVKTLAPSHPDPYYARTRAFYQAMGFAPLFESEALFGPSNPAVVLVKAL